VRGGWRGCNFREAGCVPAILAGLFTSGLPAASTFPAAGYAFVLLFYLVQSFVMFFCNTALVGAAQRVVPEADLG
jgi:hypothetical protein